MGKNKRLPNDTVLAALQLVRGQARRKAEYKRQVDEIILRSGTNFVDTTPTSVTVRPVAAANWVAVIRIFST